MTILVARPAAGRDGGARSRHASRLFQWQLRVLEDALGAGRGGSAVPHARLLQGRRGAKDPIAWTGLWRDGRVALLSGGAVPEGVEPENALTGVLTGTLGFTDNAIAVPSDYGRLRFWRHTTAAAQPAGGLERMTAGTLGYEWDQDKDNRHRPAGLMHLSSSTVPVKGIILDNDLNYEPGEATHHATLYRHSSGALVFSAATVQWSWGLDASHDTPPSVNAGPPDDCIGQATVNLLADMGVQSETLQPPFVATTASVDFTPPTSTIVTPADGETLTSGMPTAILNPLITGTAADVGGVVAGVEVSVDGGVTWSPADGTTSWKIAGYHKATVS